MKLKLMFGVMLVSAVVGAETFTYTWDGSSESYGEGHVAVTYDGASVATLVATVAEGDLVIFEGETLISFAVGATVTVNGRGSLTFKNPAEALGALTFTSDAPRLIFDISTTGLAKETLKTGGPSYLAFPGMTNLTDYVLDPVRSSLYYNNKTTINGLNCCFPERTETTYEYQGQNYNGAATRCLFFRFLQQEDGIAITNAASMGALENFVGTDFRENVPGKYNDNYQIVKAGLMAERVDGRRNVTFENVFTAGGQVSIAGGVNLRGTAKAFKTGAEETFDLNVAFDDGSLTCLEFGACHHAATISGEDGTIYYLTPDFTGNNYTYMYEDCEIIGNEMGIPTTNLVILKNTALSSVTGLTARIRWGYYQQTDGPTGLETSAGGDFKGDLASAYFEIDPNLKTFAVARFQMQRYDGTQAYCAPIVLEQVGRDIAVRKVKGYNQWTKEDGWTWDPSKIGDPNYSTSRFFITNLTFKTSSAIGGYAGEALFSTSDIFNGDRIDVVFKPGQQSSYRVMVDGYKALRPKYGHSVYAGAWVFLNVAKTSTGGGLDWAIGLYGDRSGYGFNVYPGGRVQTLLEKNNNAGQTISVFGGEYGFTPEPGTASYYRGKLSYKTFDSRQGMSFNYIGGLRFEDGGRTFGVRPRLGNQYVHTPKVVVAGDSPCRCDSGFTVARDFNGSPSLLTATIDVADVTRDEGVDFTVAQVDVVDGGAGSSVVKTGAGTVLFNAMSNRLSTAGHPMRIAEGRVIMGCTDCFTASTQFSLEGGSVTAAAGAVNEIGSLTVSENATLTLGDGSSLTVADPTAEWAEGKQLDIVGDPKLCTLKFGDGTVLARQQVRALRWNGEKCHMEPDGTIRPGAPGLVLIFR